MRTFRMRLIGLIIDFKESSTISRTTLGNTYAESIIKCFHGILSSLCILLPFTKSDLHYEFFSRIFFPKLEIIFLRMNLIFFSKISFRCREICNYILFFPRLMFWHSLYLLLIVEMWLFFFILWFVPFGIFRSSCDTFLAFFLLKPHHWNHHAFCKYFLKKVIYFPE